MVSAAQHLAAQELNCMVSVVSPQVQGSNREVYNNMQKAIYEFMNNRVWTDHIFKEEERIQCNLMLNITERISDDQFRATLQIQSNRPVYNTSYTTPVLNYRDNDVQIKYVEFMPMDFNENGQNNSLVALLAFYANIILGLDYDTFSLEGGTLFYQRAENIVNNSSNAPEPGWKAYEGNKNRYWMVENLLDGKYSSVRECLYRYHRLGLDRMSERVDEARAEIAEALVNMRSAYRENQSAMIFPLFFTAKSDEIVNIFSQSFPDEKSRVVNALKEIDPGNSAKWERIQKAGN
ncbi:MAG: DUF4835 family protein [Bacteroidales bacterium]|nr:DUF4835 family protein [Bacteroidales bacterium]